MPAIKRILLLVVVLVLFAIFGFYISESVSQQQGLKEKIGQMILLGFRGTEVGGQSNIAKIIKDLKIGGVVLFDYDVPSASFSRNITGPEQTQKLISNLQSFSDTPLLVSVDVEGGNINRLKPEYGFVDVASAQEMGEMGASFTAQESQKLAEELKDLGFNMNFAPVVDLNLNPDNPVIGKLGRSFSANPEKVSEFASVFIKQHQEAGIISVAKHFPGHGSSSEDSHLGIADVTKTYSQKELEPYFSLQNQGLVDVVMTAHIIDRNVDENYPATMSKSFLEAILREQIGFEGVIISDDMQMGAIALNYGFEDALIRAVSAGCDMLLLSNNSKAEYDEKIAYKAVDVVFNAVKRGEISEQRIEQAFNRIFDLKQKYGILQQ